METTDRATGVAGVLTTAATYAGYAPSIHNTQPWRWRIRGDRMQLWAVRERQLSATDHSGRMLTISCGAALHHARTTLRAYGWRPQVDLLPDPDQPDLLAELHGLIQVPEAAEADDLHQALKRRRTDRRPAADVAVPAPALDAVQAAAVAEGVDLHLLSPTQVIDLAIVAGEAADAASVPRDVAAEMAYWTSRGTPPGTGLPLSALPERQAQTEVPNRDFGVAGSLAVGSGHDGFARYGVLFGIADEPDLWLRAGQALSAAWLTAVRDGLSLLPLSGVIEVDATRSQLRQDLGAVGYPYLAMRLSVAHPQPPTAEPTPRIPAAQLIDTD